MEQDSVLAALAALSQATRLAIVRYLVKAGPQGSNVGPIAETLDLAAATLSFHLKELTRADLLISRQEGRFIRYAANFDTMSGLVAYLTENCCGSRRDLCAPTCMPRKKASKPIHSPRRKATK
jgi:ArsR family transcriptional regulator, arsenate/arsenite/antimonite-responsive transcriptional repressor